MDGELLSGFISRHAGDQPFREDNPGIGYLSPDGWLGGYYRNSLDRNSLYFGKRFATRIAGNDNVGAEAALIAGGVTGYGNPLSPLLLPEIAGNIGQNKLALILVPPVKGVTPATLALQYRRKF